MPQQQADDFHHLAARHTREGFFRDAWHLVRRSGKWWLIPLLVVPLALAALLAAGGTGAAPFVYTLF